MKSIFKEGLFAVVLVLTLYAAFLTWCYVAALAAGVVT